MTNDPQDLPKPHPEGVAPEDIWRSSGPAIGHQLSPHLEPGAVIGPYRIESLVDHGGMAYVYVAMDIRLDRRVALKVLALQDPDGSDFRERFLRESRFAASLDHPNIVPIYEAGEAAGLLYIAMRYVRGTNLGTLIRQHGPIDPQRTMAILAPVAEALDTAHTAGLVHRDVKPANILLSESGDHGREHVYLSDFGLTKRASAMSKFTQAGSFIGTMAYISPEQIRGEPLDARTDLYALGCVAYECLSGNRPFVRDDQAALMWAHLSQYPQPLSEIRGDLAAADQVIGRALAKNPNDRYPTCQQFTAALSAALLGGRLDRPTGVESNRSPAASPHVQTPPVPTPPVQVQPGQLQPGHQPPNPASRVTRRRLIVAIVAVVVAIATISGVTWAARTSNQVQGQAVVQDHDAAGSAASQTAVSNDATPTDPAASDRTAASQLETAASTASVLEAAPPPTASPSEGPPTVATPIPPAAAVAIPSIAGDPIPVGATPGYVAITPDGRNAYIANRGAQVVTVLDTTINKVTAVIPITAGPPQFISFSPDGTRAYVSVYNDDKTINLVVVINTRTTKPLQEIPVEKKPYALAVSPDGLSVWVPSHDAGAIDIIDVASNTVTQTLAVAKNPHWVAFSQDGRTAYVANHESNVLSVIDVASRTVITTIPVGTSPHSVAGSPDGKQVAVVCFDSNDVYFIDTATNQVIGSTPVGTNPQDVSYSADGKYLYTANVQSDTVSVIDAETYGITATIPTDSPTSVGVLPNGRYAYVTNLDTGTLTVLNTT